MRNDIRGYVKDIAYDKFNDEYLLLIKEWTSNSFWISKDDNIKTLIKKGKEIRKVNIDEFI